VLHSAGRLLPPALPLFAAALVCTVSLCWAASSPRNRLYRYQADLRDTLAALDRESCYAGAEHPPPLLDLPRKGKALDEQTGEKLKLPRGQRVLLRGSVPDGRKTWWLVESAPPGQRPDAGRRMRLKDHRSFRKLFADSLRSWRGRILADSLRVLRSKALKAIRSRRAQRELELLPDLAEQYRRHGRHRQMNPLELLRSKALPDLRERNLRVPLPFDPDLPLSTEPWGPPVEIRDRSAGAPFVLFFTGLEDGAYRFQSFADEEQAPSTTYYAGPAVFQRWAGPDLAREIGRLAEDLARRRKDARRYELLARWRPEDVDRILEGLVWLGMDDDMLLEALGEPAGRSASGEAGELWEYVRGNSLILVNGRISEIIQREGPDE